MILKHDIVSAQVRHEVRKLVEQHMARLGSEERRRMLLEMVAELDFPEPESIGPVNVDANGSEVPGEPVARNNRVARECPKTGDRIYVRKDGGRDGRRD